MSRIGVSITKSTAFRNSTQEFSNVYYYESTTPGLPSQPDASAIIDTVTTREKQLHSADVTFLKGRLWSQIGTKEQNEMIDQKNLSGTGALASLGNLDRERAHLIRIRAGVDVRGNPVYLRKWFHSGGAIATGSITQLVLENKAGFTQAQRDQIVAACQNMLSLTQGGQNWELVAKSGRAFNVPAQISAHAYLEHHQFGDMWRAQ